MPKRLTLRVVQMIFIGLVMILAVVALGVWFRVPPATADTTTFAPAGDTYVDNGTPGTNYGTSNQTVVDNSPIRRTFIKFTVANLTEAVTSAKLRVHVRNTSEGGSNAGGAVKAMSNTSWSETGVTWNNQPAIDGALLGSLGSVSRNTWYEVDVTPAITGNGTFSIGITSSSNNGAHYDSREAGANGPQLVVTTGTATQAVLVGAGDIASCGSSGDEATANLLDGIPGTVYTAGDNAYPDGTSADFNNCYGPSWGRHKSRTRPATGNHDYHTSGASGYFGYFGAAAGDPGTGYYSYDLGGWHVVVINSNCSEIGGCGAGSPQEQWLRQDLAANPASCTAALWHHPLFTSGANHSGATSMRPIWQTLYDFNADVVINGHNHQYERFSPQNPNGGLDTTRGIREFVAGTGGASHYSFGSIQPNSEVRNGDTFGVLKLTLQANGYDWQFVPEAGKSFTDSGSGTCH